MQGSVLIVDDEVGFARSFAELLRTQDYQAGTAFTAAEAREQMARMHPDVVLMDMMLPDADGSELMGALLAEYPDTAFIIVTAHGTIRTAVKATQRGAADFLTKPVEPDVMFLTVRNAMRGRAMNEEVRRLRSGALGEPFDHGFMYGRSFFDLDGHQWEVLWMDEPAAVQAIDAERRHSANAGSAS